MNEIKTCKLCGKTCSKNAKAFCSVECYSKWKVINYQVVWKGKLKYWVILDFSHRNKKATDKGHINYWNAQCKTCGIQVIRGQYELKRDTRCENCRNRPKGYSGLLELFRSYKINCAKRRNRGFNLSSEEFREITSSPCHYCGVLPYKLVRGNTPSACKHLNDWGNYVYNGIDEKVYDGGYTLDNSLPCCEICNLAKRQLSYEEFIMWINRIITFRT